MAELQVPPYPAEIVNQALEETLQALLGLGITSIQDAYIYDVMLLESLADIDRQGSPMPYTLVHLGLVLPRR